ncbi:MAG: hypothetical protein IT429_17480 [Gemmataceae bacterium]|nr:hypothetical protein [Gemmataceae bacterium]
MVRKLLAAAAVLGLLPVAGWAGYGSYGAYGHGPASMPALASLKDGEVVVRQFYPLMIPETQTVKQLRKDEQGRPVETTMQITVMKIKSRETTWKAAPASLKITDAAGDKVDAQALAERLRTEVPVLLVFEGQKLTPEYRGILKAGTLVLSAPREWTFPPPMDGPPFPKFDAPMKPIPPKAEARLTEVSFQPPEKVPAPGVKGNQAPTFPPMPEPGPGGIRPPQGLQPTLGAASIDEKGVVHIRQSDGDTRVYEAAYEVEEGGVVRKQTVKIKEVTFDLRQQSLPARAVRASLAGGDRVPPDRLPDLLRKEVTVLVSLDGRPVDPFWLQVIREDVPVLILPQAQPQYGHGGPHSAPAVVPSSPPVEGGAAVPMPAPKQHPIPPMQPAVP